MGRRRLAHDDRRRGAPRAGVAAWRALGMVAAAAVIVVASIGTAGIVWNRDSDPQSAIRNPQSAIRNLVVLPCRASGDPATQAPIATGLTDTLSATHDAARGRRAACRSRRRSRCGSGSVTDATQARREFGATLILEGGIERAGDALRVNYVLIDATTLAADRRVFGAPSAASDPLRAAGSRRHLGGRRAGACG